MAPGRGDTDALLQTVARGLQPLGLALAGTVQINTELADQDRCDMDVLVLPDGPTIRISQSLGPNSQGCRLNPDALEQSVQASQIQLAKGADVVLINKFGKHEADGRGFRDVIAEALAQDIPVVVGLNPNNKPAFDTFCDGQAIQLDANAEAILEWVGTQTGADAL